MDKNTKIDRQKCQIELEMALLVHPIANGANDDCHWSPLAPMWWSGSPFKGNVANGHHWSPLATIMVIK
jgi:hypothetical protein